jgi:hypothetical protein
MARKTGPDRATVEALFERSRERCERCGGRGEQIHHRRARGAGGTRREDANMLQNLVHICAPCHAHIESNRAWAYEHGWLVRQWADPAYQPVRMQGSWVRLSETYTLADVDWRV